MAISVTDLRANIYKIVDEVIKTGQPIDIERAGKKLRIIAVPNEQPAKTHKLEKLIPRPGVMLDSPESYIHTDWSHEWNP